MLRDHGRAQGLDDRGPNGGRAHLEPGRRGRGGQGRADTHTQTHTDTHRHRETQRDIERHRETQRDIERHGKTQRDTERQGDRETETETETETQRHRDTETQRHRDTEPCKRRRVLRCIDRWTSGGASKRAGTMPATQMADPSHRTRCVRRSHQVPDETSGKRPRRRPSIRTFGGSGHDCLTRPGLLPCAD